MQPPGPVPFVLAADPVSTTLSVIGLALSAGITVVLAIVANGQRKLTDAQRRYERLEDERDRKVEALQRDVAEKRMELHTTAEKLVDSRFREMSHELRGSIHGLLLTVEEVKVRLKEREEDLDGLGEHDHALDIKILQGLGDLKQHVIANAASKTDLNEHQKAMDAKIERIQSHLSGQDLKLGQIEQRLATARPGGRT